MKCLLALMLVAQAFGCAGGVVRPVAPLEEHYAFVNGRWFDGQGFQAATWYSVQGCLTRIPPQGRV